MNVRISLWLGWFFQNPSPVLPSDCWKRKLLNIPHDIEIQVFQYQNVQRSVFLLESSEGSGVEIIMICWVLLQKSIPTLPESQHKCLQNIEGYLAQMLESVVLAQTWWFLRFFRAFNRQNRPTCYTPCALWVFTRRCTWALQKLPEELRISWIIRSVPMQSITMSVSRLWFPIFFYFHPENWGRFPIWRAYSSDGWLNHQPTCQFPVSWALMQVLVKIPRFPNLAILMGI